jgi:hypothetical protein
MSSLNIINLNFYGLWYKEVAEGGILFKAAIKYYISLKFDLYKWIVPLFDTYIVKSCFSEAIMSYWRS